MLSPMLCLALSLFGSAEAAAASSTDSAVTTEPQGNDASGPWLTRFVPRRRQWELGAMTGLMIIGGRHDYYDPDTAPQVRTARVGPMAGLRAAYFPLTLLGIEAEGWGLWTRVPDRGDTPAFLYALRAHAILQLPTYRVVPFVLGGYGITGVRSPLDVLGNDVDAAGHYGAGVKLMADARFAVRLEGRHTMTAARARRRQVANHFSVLIGLSIRLGPEPSPSRTHERRGPVVDEPPTPNEPPQGADPAADGDGDGVRDLSDACPTLPGVFPHGCPQMDYDDDGIPDDVDPCPSVAATGDGCPQPPVVRPPPVPEPPDDAELPSSEPEPEPGVTGSAR